MVYHSQLIRNNLPIQRSGSWTLNITIYIKVTGQVKEQLGGKTKEMTDFREKYQIMVQGTV